MSSQLRCSFMFWMVPVNSQLNITVNAWTSFGVAGRFFRLYIQVPSSFLFIGNIAAFPILRLVIYLAMAFIQCPRLAGLFLPNLTKNCVPTFQQSTWCCVHSGIEFFLLFFFFFFLVPLPIWPFFLRYAISSLWVRPLLIEVILHSFLRPSFLLSSSLSLSLWFFHSLSLFFFFSLSLPLSFSLSFRFSFPLSFFVSLTLFLSFLSLLNTHPPIYIYIYIYIYICVCVCVCVCVRVYVCVYVWTKIYTLTLVYNFINLLLIAASISFFYPNSFD